MNPAEWLVLVPAMTAAVIDVRSRRIPNLVVAPALVVVLAIAWWQGAAWGAFVGMIIAAGAGLSARVAAGGGFGMGDVKLLAYCGAALGLAGVASLLLATAIGGGVLGLVYLTSSGRTGTVPYGVAITLGLAVALAVS